MVSQAYCLVSKKPLRYVRGNKQASGVELGCGSAGIVFVAPENDIFPLRKGARRKGGNTALAI